MGQQDACKGTCGSRKGSCSLPPGFDRGLLCMQWSLLFAHTSVGYLGSEPHLAAGKNGVCQIPGAFCVLPVPGCLSWSCSPSLLRVRSINTLPPKDSPLPAHFCSLLRQGELLPHSSSLRLLLSSPGSLENSLMLPCLLNTEFCGERSCLG